MISLIHSQNFRPFYCISCMIYFLTPLQCLQALEKISREQPLACLQAGAIMAVLNYIDFFSTSVQVCHSDHSHLVSHVLTRLLTYEFNRTSLYLYTYLHIVVDLESCTLHCGKYL